MLMRLARLRCLAAIAMEAPSNPGEMIVSFLITFEKIGYRVVMDRLLGRVKDWLLLSALRLMVHV